jgi:hypothetical protein
MYLDRGAVLACLSKATSANDAKMVHFVGADWIRPPSQRNFQYPTKLLGSVSSAIAGERAVCQDDAPVMLECRYDGRPPRMMRLERPHSLALLAAQQGNETRSPPVATNLLGAVAAYVREPREAGAFCPRHCASLRRAHGDFREGAQQMKHR